MLDFETVNATVTVSEPTTGGEAECPVDGDFLLPDYCPDIAAVLKCSLKPVVLSRQWSGEKLLVDGQSTIRVLYLDEERKCVRSFECLQPFSCSISMSESGADTPPVSVRLSYLNCRAASPRRLGIHGALMVKAQGNSCREASVLSDISGDSIYVRRETVCCSAPAGTAEKLFSISEVVDLGGGKPPAEMLIQYTCTPVVTECKQMTDKVIVKGRVSLCTLYAVNVSEGTTAKCVHEFPFSQILDIEGMDETLKCITHAEVLSTDIHVTADQNGANTLLAVTIKLCVRLDARRSQTAEVVTDAYSGKYPCDTAAARLVTEELKCVRLENTSLKEVLDMPSESMSEIVDLWCDTLPVSTRAEGDLFYADGHLQIGMLARDRDGSISYYEHVSDYTLQFDERCDDMTVEVALTDMEYAIIGGKIEIRLEFLVNRCGYLRAVHTALQEFRPSEEPYPEQRAALRICRAKKGESVWEIAKGCHTAASAVMEENDLDGDEVPSDMMLLVPLC